MKVLFLGIDALDRLLISELADELPNIRALQEHGTALPVRSTFPPDSDTAWATISTGMNPAQHGIVRFVDPLQKSYEILNVGSQNEVLRGRTFWERIGAAGYKAHAIFPHLCHPVWPTPGLMVARSSTGDGVQATAPDVLAGYPEPEIIDGIHGFPDGNEKGLTRRAQQLTRLARADADFALSLLEDLEWDLFFVYWSTLDAIGHFFWSYYDPTDPRFAEGHPLQSVIPETYRLYDG